MASVLLALSISSVASLEYQGIQSTHRGITNMKSKQPSERPHMNASNLSTDSNAKFSAVIPGTAIGYPTLSAPTALSLELPFFVTSKSIKNQTQLQSAQTPRWLTASSISESRFQDVPSISPSIRPRESGQNSNLNTRIQPLFSTTITIGLLHVSSAMDDYVKQVFQNVTLQFVNETTKENSETFLVESVVVISQNIGKDGSQGLISYPYPTRNGKRVMRRLENISLRVKFAIKGKISYSYPISDDDDYVGLIIKGFQENFPTLTEQLFRSNDFFHQLASSSNTLITPDPKKEPTTSDSEQNYSLVYAVTICSGIVFLTVSIFVGLKFFKRKKPTMQLTQDKLHRAGVDFLRQNVGDDSGKKLESIGSGDSGHSWVWNNNDEESSHQEDRELFPNAPISSFERHSEMQDRQRNKQNSSAINPNRSGHDNRQISQTSNPRNRSSRENQYEVAYGSNYTPARRKNSGIVHSNRRNPRTDDERRSRSPESSRQFMNTVPSKRSRSPEDSQALGLNLNMMQISNMHSRSRTLTKNSHSPEGSPSSKISKMLSRSRTQARNVSNLRSQIFVPSLISLLTSIISHLNV